MLGYIFHLYTSCIIPVCTVVNVIADGQRKVSAFAYIIILRGAVAKNNI
jgi:hypothetical protein